ncbi:hypothetical protein UG55_105132 [Frankia sp. EI5c]|uniref:hypothetical protein n=1 Tax=Frankia sp. EI5c TaxID=683316 RepID=UPI0007C3D5FA|nr:hypothetical protein [Frankia sp. EI5c]OAA22274.1 hypothetical protein UG55_105132 [Frankia sp. EI5c]
MRRRWSAHILIGTAIVLGGSGGGTALALAAQPGGTAGSGAASSGPGVESGGLGAESGGLGAESGGLGAESGGSGTPSDADAYTRCLVENGAETHTESSADGPRSTRVTLDPEHGAQAVAACEQYAPDLGLIGSPAPIEPLTDAQNATVTKCLQDAGVTFPAPGTTQVLGLPPVDEPLGLGSTAPGSGSGSGSGFGSGSGGDGGDGPVHVPGPGRSGGPAVGAESGFSGSLVIGSLSISSEAGPGGGSAPDGFDAPDPKVITALGECAQAAGLPGLALQTTTGHQSSVLVAAAGAPRP